MLYNPISRIELPNCHFLGLLTAEFQRQYHLLHSMISSAIPAIKSVAKLSLISSLYLHLHYHHYHHYHREKQQVESAAAAAGGGSSWSRSKSSLDDVLVLLDAAGCAPGRTDRSMVPTSAPEESITVALNALIMTIQHSY